MNRIAQIKILLLSFLLLTAGFISERTEAAFKILDIRHWSAPDHTRLVFDLNGLPKFEALPESDPLVLKLKVEGIDLGRQVREIFIKDNIMQKVRICPWGKEGAEISFYLVKQARWKVFTLRPYQDKPFRLVVDISRPDLENKEKEERRVTLELKTEKKKRIVVIDPGHGGEDPGAIGPKGTREKNIVLKLAQKTQNIIDGSGELKAFLTRRGDYFLPLKERIKIAQEYGADLFLSLHTNGNPKRFTRGTSVYCLSLKGASDTAAQLLAQKENASDMVGGISLVAEQKDLNSILLDLEQTHTINESLLLGGLMLSELKSVNQLQFTKPLQAGFAVLKAPSTPSVLLETAHITHPIEEKLLQKEEFQDALAKAIFTAVKNFIPRLAAKEQGSGG